MGCIFAAMNPIRENKLNALIVLGKREIPEELLYRAEQANPWFTPAFSRYAWDAVCKQMLQETALRNWLAAYPDIPQHSQTLALVMAGNIPLVGFHDLMCAYLCHWNLQIKFSSKDQLLMQWVLEELSGIDPDFRKSWRSVERLEDFDAVIATGSNNTNRYFDYYFRPYPNILRGSRNSVALLDGTETEAELEQLGDDLFLYFGFGCRNVSFLLLPVGYDLTRLFPRWEKYQWLHQHVKYMNNYDYNRTSLLLSRTPHLANEFCSVVENPSPASPVSVIHTWFYANREEALRWIDEHQNQIQVVVSKPEAGRNFVAFGQSQHPGPGDYADYIDTIKFLTEQALLS